MTTSVSGYEHPALFDQHGADEAFKRDRSVGFSRWTLCALCTGSAGVLRSGDAAEQTAPHRARSRGPVDGIVVALLKFMTSRLH